ncbi:MAG: restriction endonuclease subunit [Sphingobacterium sp.]|jgi:type I restriction enzyme S subunit|nr:restriction endonuclease subunit [Sphingobacterium sp.]
MWEKVRLEECFSLIRNGASIKQFENSCGIPITRIETISNGYLNLEKLGYANIENDEYIDFYIQNGDILMSHINSLKHLGKTALVKNISTKIIHGMNLLLLRTNGNCSYRYVKFYFETIDFYNQILNIANQSVNQSSFTVTKLRNIEIPLPPLAIQEKIADILDKADQLRLKDQELEEKYDQLAQAIFVDMFGDPVKNEKGWEKKMLNSLCSKIGSGSTPKGGKEVYKTTGMSFIRSLNIHRNEFKYKDLAFIDDKQADQLKNVIVKNDDVLFNITGASVCRAAIVPNEVLPAYVNQHVAILRSIKEKLNSVFFVSLLNNQTMNKFLYGIATQGGATREAITKEQLEKIEITVPPIDLQLKFAKKIEIINKLKLQTNTTKSEELFQSLLQKAFTGELIQ